MRAHSRKTQLGDKILITHAFLVIVKLMQLLQMFDSLHTGVYLRKEENQIAQSV
jgi:hypothetical protein